MSIVALYVRVSTDEQARGESVSDQLGALRQWAEQNGHTIADEYVDAGYSARKKYTTRPALRRLLDDVQRGKFTIICFTKLDRWFRSLRDYYAVQSVLDAHEIGWIAITEEYSTITTQGRLLLNLKLSIAEHEADLTSDRIKFTFEQKRGRGELVSGMLPHGYISVDKRPVQDPAVADGMKVFFRRFLRDGLLQPAMLAANAEGAALNTNLAGIVLRSSEKYTGTLQGCVPCEPFITWEEHLRIQEIRKKRPRRTARNLTYMFSGILWCGKCGHRFAAHYCKYPLRIGETEADRRIYISYLCSHRQNTAKAGCDNKHNVNERDIEAYLLDHLDAAVQDRIVQARQDRKLRRQPDAVSIEKKIEKLEQRKARGWEAYLDGIVEKSVFETERARIDGEISDLMREQQEQKKAAPSAESIAQAIPKNWRAIYDDLDRAHQRIFWLNIIDRIVIHPDRSISFNLSF